MKALLLFLAMAGSLAAQETRREIINAARVPADDAKLNSDQVPDVYALSARFDRVLVLRYKFDTDLLAGLEPEHERSAPLGSARHVLHGSLL